MSLSVRQFADDLPSECPPKEAVEAAGRFYACGKADPLTAEDVKTAKDRNAFIGQDECQRRAFSVFQSIKDAEALLARQKLRFTLIAVASLNATHGRMQHTPSKNHPSHHSIWAYRNVVFHSLFSVVPR